jgi:transketolase
MQCADFTENCFSLEPLDQKMTAFGFNVSQCDGNDCASIIEMLLNVRSRPVTKPVCLIAHTIKGKGLPDVENDLFAHHYLPKIQEVEAIIEKYIHPFLTEKGGS